MKQLKQIAFCSIVTFSIFSMKCIGSGHLGERPAKIMAKALVDSTQIASNAGVKATEIASNAAIEASQKVGVDATNKAAEALLKATEITAATTKDISKDVVEGVVKSSEKIGSEAVGKLVPAITIISGVIAADRVLRIGAELYAYNYPDEKEIALREAATETITAIRTKRAFRQCLMKNARIGQRNKIGFPIACEVCGEDFAMAAGIPAFNDMVGTFKGTYHNDI